MKKNIRGFTIVELLIVIVVIAILAAISVVAYNGIQQRARNAQTQQAMAQWVKALQLYKAVELKWPNFYTCLGEGYKYDVAGTASTGTYQCRQNSVSSGAIESAAFKTAMLPHIGTSYPTPAFVTASSSSTVWYRGISYLYGGGAGTDVYTLVTYDGTIGSCPAAGGVSGSYSVLGGNTLCTYLLGLTTDT